MSDSEHASELGPKPRARKGKTRVASQQDESAQPSPEIAEEPAKEVSTPEPAVPIAPVAARELVAHPRPGDEYTLQSYFDKNARVYVAFIMEMPEVRVSGPQRESVLKELEAKLEDHLAILRNRGVVLPEAIYNRRFPDRLEAKISQGLYRRLDILSRQERVPLDQLVGELLASVIERRSERSNARPQSPIGHPGNHHQQSPRHARSGHSQHRGRGPAPRRMHEALENRENFMEYVRNLEKGNWRKK